MSGSLYHTAEKTEIPKGDFIPLDKVREIPEPGLSQAVPFHAWPISCCGQVGTQVTLVEESVQ